MPALGAVASSSKGKYMFQSVNRMLQASLKLSANCGWDMLLPQTGRITGHNRLVRCCLPAHFLFPLKLALTTLCHPSPLASYAETPRSIAAARFLQPHPRGRSCILHRRASTEILLKLGIQNHTAWLCSCGTCSRASGRCDKRS